MYCPPAYTSQPGILTSSSSPCEYLVFFLSLRTAGAFLSIEKKAKHYIEIMPGSTSTQEQPVWAFFVRNFRSNFFSSLVVWVVRCNRLIQEFPLFRGQAYLKEGVVLPFCCPICESRAHSILATRIRFLPLLLLLLQTLSTVFPERVRMVSVVALEEPEIFPCKS